MHTCDNRSQHGVWELWLKSYKKFWSNYVPVVIAYETIKPPWETEPGMEFEGTGEEAWSNRFMEALYRLREWGWEYVFYMQEDYILCNPISDEIVTDLIHLMSTGVDRIGLGPPDVWSKDLVGEETLAAIRGTNLLNMKNDKMYSASHQFSLWNISYLLSLQSPGHTAWSGEVASGKIVPPNAIQLIYPKKLFHAVITRGERNSNWDKAEEAIANG
jgi:hypothetical protein